MSNFTLPKPRHAAENYGPFQSALRSQLNVMHALILHDIKSRFFGNGFGYIVTILWPTVHIIVIMGIYIIMGRAVPYGQSAMLYAATGVLPYIAWNYISRFMSLSMTMNKSFRAYPVVQPLDMMHARLVLECVSIFTITIGMIFVLAICQVPVMPYDPGEGVLGLLSAIVLGIGFG